MHQSNISHSDCITPTVICQISPKHNHHFKIKSYNIVGISYLHIVLMICKKNVKKNHRGNQSTKTHR